jgi:ABC-type uncharacterized transport system fused permease/ATPase subunit
MGQSEEKKSAPTVSANTECYRQQSFFWRCLDLKINETGLKWMREVIRLEQMHGTTVAMAGQGLLIIGPSGSGKSSLALDLMSKGMELVSDDRTDLERR